MWNEEDRKWLYEQMTNDGVDAGSYEEFSKSLENKEDRDWYYQRSLDMGLDVGSADDFAAMMVKPVEVQAPKQQEVKKEQPAAAANSKSGVVIGAKVGGALGATAATQQQQQQAQAQQVQQQQQQQPKQSGLTERQKVAMAYQMAKNKNAWNNWSTDFKARTGRIMTTANFIPESRKKRELAKRKAKLLGTETQVMGITPPAQQDAQAASGSSSEKNSGYTMQSPVPYDVVTDENGKRVTQWLLPDGRLTTNITEADQAEYIARSGRLRHEFEGRMKANGLNPDNQEDVQKQAQLDYLAPMLKAIESAYADAEEAQSQADAEYNKKYKEYTHSARGVMDAANLDPSGMPKPSSMETMMNMDLEAKRQQIFSSDRLAQQAFDRMPESFRNELLKGASKQDVLNMIKGYVFDYTTKQHAPQSVSEYIIRRIADQPLLSMPAAIRSSVSAQTGNYDIQDADAMAMQIYGQNHTAANVAGTVLNMAFDPTTYMGGGAGKWAATKTLGWLGPKFAAASPLLTRVITGAAAGSANLGTYNTLKNIQEQIANGGVIDPETGERSFSGTELLKSASHGVLLGAGTGIVSPIIGNYGDKVVQATTSTGGKIATRAAETTIATVAEGTIFSIPEWIEGKRDAWDVWTQSLATMAGFKVSHGIKSIPERIAEFKADGKYKSFGERVSAALDKSPRDLDITREEREELKSKGYGDLADIFTRKTPGETKRTKRSLDGAIDFERPEVLDKNEHPELDGYDTLEALMNDNSVSEATRAKLYYILTGRMLPMSTVMGYTIRHEADGTYTVESVAAGENVVTRRRFKTKDKADAEVEKISRQAELNVVDAGEKLKENEVNNKLFQQAAADVLPGVDVNEAYKIYAKVKGGVKDVTPEQKKFAEAIDEAMDQYNEVANNERPEAIRNNIKEETGVDIDNALRKQAKDRTEAEQKAVMEYIHRLYPEEAFANENSDGQTGNAANARQQQLQAKIDESDETIDSRTDENGQEVSAVLRNGKKVYVIDGNVVLREDGTIDVTASDKTIVVRGEDGVAEMISPKDIESVGDPIDAAEHKDQVRNEIITDDKAQRAQELSVKHEGKDFGQFTEEEKAEIDQLLGEMTNDELIAYDHSEYEIGENHDALRAVIEDELISRGCKWDGRTNEWINSETEKGQKHNQYESLSKEMKGIEGLVPDELGVRLSQFDRALTDEERTAFAELEYLRNGESRLFNYLATSLDGKYEFNKETGKFEAVNDEPAADAAGTVTDVVPGEYDITYDGNPGKLEITADNGDGTVTAKINGGEERLIAKETASQLINGTVEQQEPAAVAEGTGAVDGVDVAEDAAGADVVPMPMKADGKNPDFLAVTPERTVQWWSEESNLPAEIQDTFINNFVKEAETALAKSKKNEPKPGTDIAAYQQKMANWQAKQEQAQAQLDYWNKVKEIRGNQELAKLAELEEQQRQETIKAKAEEEARIAAEQQKAAEQAALGSNAVAPVVADKWAAAHKIEGNPNEIVLPNGEKVEGKYMLVEAGAATASHNPANGFAKSEGYPVDENGQSINDRDYERDKSAQEITRQIADRYDSRALQTPVVVSQDGVVLSGNGRTMAGDIAAANYTDGAYIEHLVKYPQQYGFTPEQVLSMQHPRVVFVPNEPQQYNAETLAKYNQQEMKSQDKTEQAVKLGKIVDDNTFKRIVNAMNGFNTLGEFYADTKAAHDAIMELQKAGVFSQAQVAEMFDGDVLSPQGRELLENTLIGKAFESNPDAIRQISEYKAMRQTIIQALAEITNNIALGKDYSLEQQIADAIALVYKARKHGYKAGEPVSPYARQGNLFQLDEGATAGDINDVTMLTLADIINNGRTTLLKKTLHAYNSQAAASAAGQLDVFTGGLKTREELINDINQTLRQNGQDAEGYSRSNESGQQTQPVATSSEASGERVILDEQASRKLGETGKECLNAISSVTGSRYRFISGPEVARALGITKEQADETPGFYNRRTGETIINSDFVGATAGNSGVDAVLWTAGHELTHLIRTASDIPLNEKKALQERYKYEQTLWDHHKNFVRGAMGEEEWNKRVERISAIYRDFYPELDEKEFIDAVEEEVVANWDGENCTNNPEAIKEMVEAAEKSGVDVKKIVTKIMDYIISVLTKLAKLRGTPEVIKRMVNLEAAKKTYEAMLEVHAAKQREAETRKAVENGEVKFSNATYMPFTDNKGQEHEGTRAQVLDMLNSDPEWSKKDIKKFMNEMDFWYDFNKRIADFRNADGTFKFPEFRAWTDRIPRYKEVAGKVEKVMSSLVKNGEYAANVELSTDCIKREALTTLLNAVASRGGNALQALNAKEFEVIKKMMGQYGIQVACPMCFIEGKRLGIRNWAQTIVDDWNRALNEALGLGFKVEQYRGRDTNGKLDPKNKKRSRIKDIEGLTEKVGAFNFYTGDGVTDVVTDQEIDDNARDEWTATQRRLINEVYGTLSDRSAIREADLVDLQRNAEEYRQQLLQYEVDWNEKHPDETFSPDKLTEAQKETLDGIANAGNASVYQKMVQAILDHPELRHTLTLNDLIGSTGITALRSSDGEAAAKMFSLIVSRFGTATPKVVQGAEPYAGEIMELTPSTIAKAYTQGGIRMFSFSDFDLTKLFDIMQILFDAAARRAKMQSYSKEVPYILMAGTTGIKINMSMLPEVKVPKPLLDRYNKANKNEKAAIMHEIQEYAGLELDENGKITGMQLSMSHSIREDFAKRIFHDDKRNANCGPVMVGVSVNHSLWACLTDYIRQVIPFHLSGMPIASRNASDVQWYVDATRNQNTSIAHLTNTAVKDNTSKEWKSIGGSATKKLYGTLPDFNIYEGIDEPGWDMRQRVAEYIAWCDQGITTGNGTELSVRPKFWWGVNSDAYLEYCQSEGYKPNLQILDGMRQHETEYTINGKKYKVFDGYYKMITDYTAYKPIFDKDGNMVGEELAPHNPVTANFDRDENIIKAVFGEDGSDAESMLGNRERSIQNANKHNQEMADHVIEYLNSPRKNADEAKLLSYGTGEEFKNASDSELYMESQGDGIKLATGVKKGKPIFISNAQKAVEDIKQNKATGDQWLAMLKKNGGLKAEEDKWMGLSDYLKDKKSVTKDELLQYIAENDVQIEEVQYSGDDLRYQLHDKLEPYNQEYMSLVEQLGDKQQAFDAMVEKYGEEFGQAFRGSDGLVPNGRYERDDDDVRVFVPSDAAYSFLGLLQRPINPIRENYQTKGLTNNREIALVVPTVEQYNPSDEVHFGDAGDGRAVAWTRFGDATDVDGNKVLVIDEIQSKRHQDARENGYYTAKYSKEERDAEMKAFEESLDKESELRTKHAAIEDKVNEAADNEDTEQLHKLTKEYDDLWEQIIELSDKNLAWSDEIDAKYNVDENRVPDAPWQKNWHELAMKRMLRYAAENGYDKIAWTTGTQQAERYNLGKVVDSIDYRKSQIDDESYEIEIYDKDGNRDDGLSGDYSSQELRDFVGKEVAAEIEEKATEDFETVYFDEDRLVGGEGMQGFYDQMLPRFMDKYCKKWGAKTQDIELDLPNEADRVMHSVDVTPEMKESVMQGQVKFATGIKKGPKKSLVGIHNISESNLVKALKNGGLANPSMAVVDSDKGMHTEFGDISLIAPSSLIDKKTGNNAGTWTDDVWTPTYPKTVTIFTDKGRKAFDKMLDGVEGNRSYIRWMGYNVVDEMRNGYAPSLQWLFLQSKGIDATMYEGSKANRTWEDYVLPELGGYKTSRSFLNAIKKDPELRKKVNGLVTSQLWDKLKAEHPEYAKREDENYKTYYPRYVEIVEKEIIPLKDAEGNFSDEVVAEAFNEQKRLQSQHSSLVDNIGTNNRASMIVMRQGLESDYSQWVNDTLEGLGVETKIRDGVDRNGNARYIPDTLENASKVMNKDQATGGHNYGGWGTFIAQIAENMGSLDEIRSKKDMLQRGVENTLREDFSSAAIMLSNATGLDLWDGSASRALANIVKNSKDVKGYVKKRYGATLDDDEAEALKDFADEFREVGSDYFETKFERPVRFEEFAAAVVPKTTSEDIIAQLEGHGLQVYKYDPKKEGNREKVQQRAAKMDGIKFATGIKKGDPIPTDVDKANAFVKGTTPEQEMQERQEKEAARREHSNKMWHKVAELQMKYGGCSNVLKTPFDRNVLNGDKEFRKCFNNDQKEIDEAIDNISKDIAGFALKEQEKIIIFTDRADNENDVEITFFHENFHVWIYKTYGDSNTEICENYWNALDKDETGQGYKASLSAILENCGYEIERYPEEAMAYLIGLRCSKTGQFKIFTKYLSDKDNELLDKFFDFINYDREKERKERRDQSRIEGEDKRSTSIPQRRGKEDESVIRRMGEGTGGRGGTEETSQLGQAEIPDANAPGTVDGTKLATGSEKDDIRYATGVGRGPRIPGLDMDNGRLTMEEALTQGLITLANSNADNADKLQQKLAGISGLTGELRKMRQAVSAIRTFDKSAVNAVISMAKLFNKNGLLDNIGRLDRTRLLNAINKATGYANLGAMPTEQRLIDQATTDLSKAARDIVDVMLTSQLRAAREMIDKAMSLRDSKVSSKGVEEGGILDPMGQAYMAALRDGIKNEKALSDAIADASDRMSDSDPEVAEAAAQRYAGFMLAQRYIEDIKDSEADERAIKQHMKEALEDKKAGNITTDAYRDLVENLEDELFQNRVDRVIASRNIVEQLTNDLRSSVQAAIDFQARERQRVEDIQHNANSDLEGRKCDEHIRPTAIDHAMNSQWLRFPTAPMANFVMMLRMIGGKNIRGEGYLYNRFMRQWVDATDAEWRNWKQASAELDAKAKEVTGKKRWSDLYDITRKKGATISFWDGDEMKEHELTQGNLMYMYMAAKMKDGRVKLNAMGLTDAEIVNVSQALDPRLKTLADWLQEEYLPMKRKAYNQVHVRMFGAPMAGIDNYFPLKILSNARKQDVDVNGAQQEQLPGEVTENIIKRKHNITPLDILGTDAVSLTVEHIQRMENWRAFAEFRRDLKILLSYKKFRNRLKNMHSVQYGSGEELWKNFVDVCTIAAGQYRPSDARLDRAFNTLGKMVTGAKIAFLPYTALKQLTSFPAYLSSSNWAALTASTAMWPTAFTWAMKNLPTFSKRWESRQAGNYLLKDMTNWAYSQKRFIEKLIRAGMTPNAFIDGLTVAIGARAIFWTKQRQYKALGYSPEDARKRALQDAAISVNETQQSGEGAFMSPMQASRTSLGSLVSMFRNSPFGYTRQVTDAIRNMKNFLELKNAKDRIAFRTKQLVRDGIDEEDAKKFAWAEYGKTPARESIRFAVFAWGLQFLWDLMPNMIYLLTGDDDDEKDAIVEDAMQHALWGGIEGFSGGNLISDNGHMLVSGSDLGNANFTVSPLMSDIQTIFKHLKSDQVMAYNDIFNLAIQAKLGVNPQAIEGVAEAFYDACNGDPETMHETAIFIARLINMPQSGIEKLWIDEVSMPADKAKQTIEQGNFYEIAKRYADYKVRRGAYATRWLYEDGARDEAVVKQMKLFEKKVKERWKKSGSKDLDEMYENLTKQLEPVSKQKERANYLKHTGQYAEYSQAMLNLAKDPNFVAMNIYNHNKSIINRLDNLAMKAQSVEDYKKFRAMSLEQKRALFVTLSAIKNGGTAPDWAINLITSEEPKPETPEPEVIVEEVEVPVYITDDGYEE